MGNMYRDALPFRLPALLAAELMLLDPPRVSGVCDELLAAELNREWGNSRSWDCRDIGRLPLPWMGEDASVVPPNGPPQSTSSGVGAFARLSGRPKLSTGVC